VAVAAASAVQTVTLTTGALVIKSTALTGVNAMAFVESNPCGTSLSAGARCAISVKDAGAVARKQGCRRDHYR
jgi:hypothetical protein